MSAHPTFHSRAGAAEHLFHAIGYLTKHLLGHMSMDAECLNDLRPVLGLRDSFGVLVDRRALPFRMT
jgi:hypothetical protein